MRLDGKLHVGGADAHAALYAVLGDLGARSAGDRAGLPRLPGSPEERFAVAVERSRHDPRLLEVVVDLLARRWRHFDPVRLRIALRRIPSPAATGVVCAFAARLPGEPERSHLFDYLLQRLEPAPWQLYFVALHAPGGRLMAGAAERPRPEYERWGFLGSALPFSKDAKPARSPRFSPRVRGLVLRDLLATGRWLRMADYLDAVERSITRQQALADLERVRGLLRRGRGRGARFRLRRS